MVRLKENARREIEEAKQSFNSIVVRLKVGQVALRDIHGAQFQFHSGSIKSFFVQARFKRLSWFQFHSGSIKSAQLEVGASRRACFNSIVVRLKAPCRWIMSSRNLGFNSIVVRLKGRPRRIRSLAPAFQFHSGSIKSDRAQWCSICLTVVSIP